MSLRAWALLPYSSQVDRSPISVLPPRVRRKRSDQGRNRTQPGRCSRSSAVRPERAATRPSVPGHARSRGEPSTRAGRRPSGGDSRVDPYQHDRYDDRADPGDPAIAGEYRLPEDPADDGGHDAEDDCPDEAHVLTAGDHEPGQEPDQIPARM